MAKKRKKSRIVKRRVWATWMGGRWIPCLWESRQEAVANCCDDEVVVLVNIEFATVDRRGRPERLR